MYRNLPPGSFLSALPFAGERAGVSLVALCGQVLQTVNPFHIPGGIFQSLDKTLGVKRCRMCPPAVSHSKFLFSFSSVVYILVVELRGTGLFPRGRTSQG